MKNVRKILEVSTAHISELRAQMLDSALSNIMPAMSRDEGWLLHVPEDLSPFADEADIMPLFALAQDAGCDWILLDRDVEPVEYLPLFEW